MKHRKKGRKFGRVRKQRKALLKSLMEGLVKHEKIKTTEAKAKELRPLVEKIISRSRKDSPASRRYIAGYLGAGGVKKIFGEIGPRYRERPGGYTRIYKLLPRKRDNSKMAIIELV